MEISIKFFLFIFLNRHRQWSIEEGGSFSKIATILDKILFVINFLLTAGFYIFEN